MNHNGAGLLAGMLRQHSSRRQPGQVHRRATSVPDVVIAGCAKPGKKKSKPRRRLSDQTKMRFKPVKTHMKKTKTNMHTQTSESHLPKEDVLHTKLKATQDYVPQEPDELHLYCNHIYHGIKYCRDGQWWLGRAMDGTEGVFPASLVKEMVSDSAPDASTSGSESTDGTDLAVAVSVGIQASLAADQAVPQLFTVADQQCSITQVEGRVFSGLRQNVFGIADETFKESLRNLKGGCKGEGKSESLFFSSTDKRFILKTVNRGELATLRAMLDDYVMYMAAHGEKSLLSRFYAVFEMAQGSASHTFVVMDNVMQHAKAVDVVFDLKGCSLGRTVKADTEADTSRFRTNAQGTLKDGNFRTIFFPLHAPASALHRIIWRDCDFLEGHEIMDYSLLVAVERAAEAKAQESRRVRECVAQERGDDGGGSFNYAVVHFGIIDILQRYDGWKKIAHYYKLIAKPGATTHNISSVCPQQYAARFAAFMVAHIQDGHALTSAPPPPRRYKAREMMFDPGEPLGLRFQWDASNRRPVVMRFRCLPDGAQGQAEALGVLVEGKSYLTHINGAAVAGHDLASALGPIAAIQHAYKGETLPSKLLRLKFESCLATGTVMAHAHPRTPRGRSRRLSAAQALPDNILGQLGALDSPETVPAYIARMCSFELPSYEDLKAQVLHRFGSSVFELYKQQIQALLGLASSTYAIVAGASDTQTIADKNPDTNEDNTSAKHVVTTAAMAVAAAKAANKATSSVAENKKKSTKNSSEVQTSKTADTLPPRLELSGKWDEPTITALNLFLRRQMRCRRATRQRSRVSRLCTPPRSVFDLKSLRQLQLTLRAAGAGNSVVPVLPRAKATTQSTTLAEHPDTVLALKRYLNQRSSLDLRRPLKMNKARLGARTLRVLQQHLNHQLGHR